MTDLAVDLRPQQPITTFGRPVNVFGWVSDFQGCGYYRIALPLSALPAGQFRTAVDNQVPMDYWNHFDVVVGQRVCKPGNTGLWQQICRNPDVKAVFELDDDLWNVDPSNTAASALYSQPEIRGNLELNAAAADLVTVSTEQLAERIRPLNPNVVVIPNFINAAVLDLARPDQAVGTVTIGWAGSPTHEMDWAVAKREITRLVANHAGVRMGFIGARFPQGMPRDRVSWTPWQQDMGRYYDHLLSTFDVGVAPLAHHPFNEAKSHLKALEYAAAGIPSVVSSEAPYEGFVRQGETGFLVRQPHEWGRYLRQLVNDRDMRVAMGDAGREQAKQWTIQANISRWAEALR